MNIAFSTRGWEDDLHWHAADRKVTSKIHELIKDILRHPFEGIGKPEPLKHRMVYRVTKDAVIIIQLRLHY